MVTFSLPPLWFTYGVLTTDLQRIFLVRHQKRTRVTEVVLVGGQFLLDGVPKWFSGILTKDFPVCKKVMFFSHKSVLKTLLNRSTPDPGSKFLRSKHWVSKWVNDCTRIGTGSKSKKVNILTLLDDLVEVWRKTEILKHSDQDSFPNVTKVLSHLMKLLSFNGNVWISLK